MKASALSITLILAPLLLLPACNKTPAGSLQAGATAPDFRAQDLLGQTRYLNAELAKPVILVFFATWCPPCRDEIPHLIDLHSKFAGKATILTIVVDPENVDRVRRLARDLSIPYPMLLDEGRKITEAYGASELPVTFIINTDRTIVSRYTGFGEAEARALRRQIERIGSDR